MSISNADVRGRGGVIARGPEARDGDMTGRSAYAELERGVVLERKVPIADDVVLLTMHRPDGGWFPEWAPGAHVDLVLRPDMVRQYSLCGDPADRSVLQVAVLHEREGRGGSEYIHELLSDGDRIRLRGPRNHFALIDAPRYLFIAGGIGITPIVPMVAAVESTGADWQLVYGGRTRASMAFRQELCARYGNRVTVCPQDETGLLDLETLLGTPQPDTVVYSCGPEPLLLAVETCCRRWPSGALHVERFAARSDLDFGPRRAFEVELARSGLTVKVPEDRSIVDVVEEVGVQVLCSCQEGTCGTCETRVLGGIPEHRDSVLTDEEQAANDKMMVCVSRACGSRLVLDL